MAEQILCGPQVSRASVNLGPKGVPHDMGPKVGSDVGLLQLPILPATMIHTSHRPPAA